jgi:transcriptional regulator with XRE-family HTH domain
MDFPSLLQEAQERLGFTTRKEFAAFLGIDPSQLTRYMKGMEPRLRSLAQVLHKLGYELPINVQEPEIEPRLFDGTEESDDQADTCRVLRVDFTKHNAYTTTPE